MTVNYGYVDTGSDSLISPTKPVTGFMKMIERKQIDFLQVLNPLSPNSVQDQSSHYNYPYTVQR